MQNNLAWGPETLAKSPQNPMDALSEILQSVKLDGAVFYNAEFTAPWGVRSPSSREVATFLRRKSKHLIMYHLLTQGRARCEVEHGNLAVELVGT